MKNINRLTVSAFGLGASGVMILMSSSTLQLVIAFALGIYCLVLVVTVYAEIKATR